LLRENGRKSKSKDLRQLLRKNEPKSKSKK